MRPTKPTIRDHLVALPDSMRRMAAHRGVRLALAVAMALVATSVTVGAHESARAARERWEPTQTVWVAAADLDVGTVLSERDVRPLDVPSAMLIGDAVAVPPVGAVVLEPVVDGEILRAARLHALGAAVPDRRVIRLSDPEPHLRVGARLTLHRRLDGVRVATNARVVEMLDDDVPVIALAADDLDTVLAALTTGGVTPVIVD